MVCEIFKYAYFNVDALLSLAYSLHGRAAWCDLATPPQAGSLNWTILVYFEDGVKWIFRAPRLKIKHFMPDCKSILNMLSSEAATLKYLKAHTTIPVPEVYSYKYMPSFPHLYGLPKAC